MLLGSGGAHMLSYCIAYDITLRGLGHASLRGLVQYISFHTDGWQHVPVHAMLDGATVTASSISVFRSYRCFEADFWWRTTRYPIQEAPE